MGGKQHREVDWSIVEYKPSGRLGRYIECVWCDNYPNDRGTNVHHVVPDDSVELIFTDTEIHRSKEGEVNFSSRKSQLVGLKTQYQMVKTSHSPAIGVRLKPDGVATFLKEPVKNTIDKVLPLSTVFCEDINELENKVLNARDFPRRVMLIEDYFNKQLVKCPSVENKQWDAMFSELGLHGDSYSVSHFANAFHLSVKSLERKFIKNLGVTPKRYLKTRRIARVLHAIATNNGSLTRLAHDYGFYDQAHLIREVKSTTGMTPKDYRSLDKGIQSPRQN